jgi:hypothetical protein
MIFIFATIAFLFCYWISGETPASSDFFFYFMSEPFFLHEVAAGGGFLLHVDLTVQIVDPMVGDPGAGESDPPGTPSTFQFIK